MAILFSEETCKGNTCCDFKKSNKTIKNKLYLSELIILFCTFHNLLGHKLQKITLQCQVPIGRGFRATII